MIIELYFVHYAKYVVSCSPMFSSMLCLLLTFIIYFPHHVYFERQSRMNYAAIYELIYRRRQHLYDNKQEGMITRCLIKLDDAASDRIILFTILMEAFYINYINGKVRTISMFIFILIQQFLSMRILQKYTLAQVT